MQGPEAVHPVGQVPPRLGPEPHYAAAPPPPPYDGGPEQVNPFIGDLRRLTRNGWLCVIVGILIPPLELLACGVGAVLITRARPVHGITMIVLAVAIFAARLALYFG